MFHISTIKKKTKDRKDKYMCLKSTKNEEIKRSKTKMCWQFNLIPFLFYSYHFICQPFACIYEIHTKTISKKSNSDKNCFKKKKNKQKKFKDSFFLSFVLSFFTLFSSSLLFWVKGEEAGCDGGSSTKRMSLLLCV